MGWIYHFLKYVICFQQQPTDALKKNPPEVRIRNLLFEITEYQCSPCVSLYALCPIKRNTANTKVNLPVHLEWTWQFFNINELACSEKGLYENLIYICLHSSVSVNLRTKLFFRHKSKVKQLRRIKTFHQYPEEVSDYIWPSSCKYTCPILLICSPLASNKLCVLCS